MTHKTDREILVAEIKSEVMRLHQRGSNDWQTLQRQIDAAFKPLIYNPAQIVSRRHWETQGYPIHYDRWGRGTGKTTSIGGKIVHAATSMPRGIGQFIAPSYKYLLTRIIPSIVNGLELHGWYQGVHYFIGEKPPRSWKWEMPYHVPRDFSKFFITHTGFGMHFISQDVAGDGRGLNTDIEFGDESALLDYAMMEENTTPTLRGSRAEIFKKSPLFRKRFHHSSMPLTQTGGWIFDLEDKNIQGEKAALIIDANCKCNLRNLADNYLEDAKKTSANDIIYDAEYLNIRPPVSGPDGFYPLLSEAKHGYRPQDAPKASAINTCVGDGDLVAGVPLLLGVDFGTAINFVAVAQHLRSINELRDLNDFYVTSQEGKIQDDAFEAFDNYYRPHQASCPDIFLCYDKTGNVETGNTRQTRAEQAREFLQKRGWRVRLMSVGRKNVDHSPKFTIWEKILQNSPTQIVFPHLPHFRINILRARTTLISMYNSKARDGRQGQIHKDKTIEAKMLRRGERHHATDGSDALDTIAEALFMDTHRFGGVSLPSLSVR